MTIEVSEELEQRLREEADRCGVPLSDYVRPALEALIAGPGRIEVTDNDAIPVYLKTALRIAETLSDEDVARFPVEGARELDHYTYGLPKRGDESP